MTTTAPSNRLREAFTAEDYAKIDRPSLEAYNLPPRAFHDTAAYDAELDRIFHNEWFCVGRLEDIDAEGGALLRHVDTQEVRITRAADGTLDCTDHIEEWNGFLFVHLGADPTPLRDNLSEVHKWGAENYALHDERSVHRFEWDCAANWKLLVENFVEEYHVAWVHAESFHPTMPMQRWQTFPEITTQPWSYMFGDFRETSMSTDGPALFPLIKSLTDRERGGMGIVTVYPNLMLILAVDCLVYYYVLPEGINKTKVVAHFCLPNEVADRVEAGDRH